MPTNIHLNNFSHKHKSIAKIFFVGTTVNPLLCDATPAGSVAGNKFQLGLVTELTNLGHCDIKIISLQPYPMYPKAKKICFGPSWCVLNDKNKAFLIPFINIPIIKQITASLSIFFALVLGLFKSRSSHCIVLVYNVFSPFSIPVLMASKLFGCKSVAIIADLPFDGYVFKGWKGFLQRMDFFVQTHIISKFSGVIALTPRIIDDFCPLLPSIIIEGGIEIEEQTEFRNLKKSDHVVCLYSGALNEINGISLLLESFSLILNSNFRLWIFGDGPLSTLVEQAVMVDKRIIYWGKIANDQVKKYQKEATILINPRISNNKITNYTFPSKLLEYMSSGRPVISTKLSGIPKDYYKHLILLERETPVDLARLIEEVCLGKACNIDNIGNDAKKFITETKNWNYQSKVIFNFLSNL